MSAVLAGQNPAVLRHKKIGRQPETATRERTSDAVEADDYALDIEFEVKPIDPKIHGGGLTALQLSYDPRSSCSAGPLGEPVRVAPPLGELGSVLVALGHWGSLGVRRAWLKEHEQRYSRCEHDRAPGQHVS